MDANDADKISVIAFHVGMVSSGLLLRPLALAGEWDDERHRYGEAFWTARHDLQEQQHASESDTPPCVSPA